MSPTLHYQNNVTKFFHFGPLNQNFWLRQWFLSRYSDQNMLKNTNFFGQNLKITAASKDPPAFASFAILHLFFTSNSVVFAGGSKRA